MLDRMDIEQERGITIKLTPARMHWKGTELNLIDTPGHVDFQYEVSRSLAAVEWAILLIDASQGIQAQTLSTLYQAIDQNLTIIPVLNKIDLPAANPERVAHEIENVLGIDKSEIINVSWKTGENVEKVLDAIIERIQDPTTFKKNNPKKYRPKAETSSNKERVDEAREWSTNLTRALIFDSVYDPYKWVLAYVKIIDGEVKTWQELHLIHSHNGIIPSEVWYFTPDYKSDKVLKEGQIWYIVTGQKSVRDISIWDTIIKHATLDMQQVSDYTIPGFKRVKPYVYAGIYPIDTNDYDKLKDSLEKLSINDSAIEYELEDSKALWFGFRCGFLWMLHMDIVKERLAREYNMETIFTIPTVVYLVRSKNLSIPQIKSGTNIPDLIKSWLYKQILKLPVNNQSDLDLDSEIPQEILDQLHPWLVVKSWADMVEYGIIDEIREPITNVEVVWPESFAGNVMSLCQEYRGKLKNMDYIDEERVVRHYEMPMGEIIIDFYDRLKSSTKWYATMNYEFKWYEPAELVKIDIFINNEKVEALSRVVHKDKSYYLAREVVERLKTLIPKHLFIIPIQAAIGTKIIARETIGAMRKDVIAKCYGWDVTRKRKLLAKQKEGKKKMKALGNVNVPGDVFIKMVTRD